MPRKPTLADLLGHPQTRSVMQQLSQGMDPRLVAAQFAGDMLMRQMAEGMGLQLPLPEPVMRPRAARMDSQGDVIDVDYTVIDVTPRKGK